MSKTKEQQRGERERKAQLAQWQFQERYFWNAYYGQLSGAVIEETSVALDGGHYGTGQLIPRFVVKLRNGKRYQIELLSDEEGNGAGFIDGLPRPKE